MNAQSLPRQTVSELEAGRFAILDCGRTQTGWAARKNAIIIGEYAVEIGGYVFTTLVTGGHSIVLL